MRWRGNSLVVSQNTSAKYKRCHEEDVWRCYVFNLEMMMLKDDSWKFHMNTRTVD